MFLKFTIMLFTVSHYIINHKLCKIQLFCRTIGYLFVFLIYKKLSFLNGFFSVSLYYKFQFINN